MNKNSSTGYYSGQKANTAERKCKPVTTLIIAGEYDPLQKQSSHDCFTNSYFQLKILFGTVLYALKRNYKAALHAKNILTGNRSFILPGSKRPAVAVGQIFRISPPYVEGISES